MKTLTEAGAARGLKLPWQMCDGHRTHVVILTCEKCGAVKEIKNKI